MPIKWASLAVTMKVRISLNENCRHTSTSSQASGSYSTSCPGEAVKTLAPGRKGSLPVARRRRSRELVRHDDYERACVARLEWDLLIERTQSSLKRARLEGKILGRPSTLSEKQIQDVRNDLALGLSASAVAKKYPTSRQAIMRAR